MQTRVQTAALQRAADRLRRAAADASELGRGLGRLGHDLDDDVLGVAVRRLGTTGAGLLDVVRLDLELHATMLVAGAETYTTTEQSLMPGAG